MTRSSAVWIWNIQMKYSIWKHSDYLAYWTALEKKSKNFEGNPSVCEQHPPVTAWIILATKTLLMSCGGLRYSLKYTENNSKNWRGKVLANYYKNQICSTSQFNLNMP